MIPNDASLTFRGIAYYQLICDTNKVKLSVEVVGSVTVDNPCREGVGSSVTPDDQPQWRLRGQSLWIVWAGVGVEVLCHSG